MARDSKAEISKMLMQEDKVKPEAHNGNNVGGGPSIPRVVRWVSHHVSWRTVVAMVQQTTFFFIKASSLSDSQQCDFKGDRKRPLSSKIPQPRI